MISRLYETWCPKGRKWFTHLLFDLEVCCQLHLHHLIYVHTLNGDLEKVEERKSVIDSTIFLQKVIPQSLRLCNTFFIQMVIAGKFNDINNGIPPHLDEDDIISCIITLGSPNNGGNTDYYDGINKNMFGDKLIRFHLNIANYKLDV